MFQGSQDAATHRQHNNRPDDVANVEQQPSTHFVLRRYKELDVELLGEDGDDRGNYLL